MKLNLSLLTLLIWAIACTLAPAQTQDAETGQLELRACLVALTGDAAASFEAVREFQITPPGERTPSITVRLIGEQLDYFQCPNFTVSDNAGGHNHDITDASGKDHRKMTYSEVHGFRPYLSLDPYWVLCHVSDNLDAFLYTETEERLGIFDRREMVSLADASQKLYGIFQETLVVDAVRHVVLSYSVLALDPDKVPLQDMVNDYTQDQITGPALVTVVQSAAVRQVAPVSYTVTYRKQ